MNRKFKHIRYADTAEQREDGRYNLIGGTMLYEHPIPAYLVEASADWVEIVERKPLFTTYDGVDVFCGKEYFFVYTETLTTHTKPWEVYGPVTALGDDPGYYPELDARHMFSTREAAEKYIEQNKPKDAAEEYFAKEYPHQIGEGSVASRGVIQIMRDFAEQQCQPLRDRIKELQDFHSERSRQWSDAHIQLKKEYEDRIAVIEDENMTLRSHIEHFQIGAARWKDEDMIKYAKECADYIRQNDGVYYEGALYSFVERKKAERK